jgi:diaminopimelate decarboxylase
LDTQVNMPSEALTKHLSDRYGTPLYLVDFDAIERAYNIHRAAWDSAIANVSIVYCYKANPLPAITNFLRSLGAGAEVASGPELQGAITDGHLGPNIYFDGPLKTSAELDLATQVGALVQVDSLEELDLLLASGRPPRVSLRIACRYRGLSWSRFGLTPHEADLALARTRAAGVRCEGVHVHVGSNMSTPATHVEAVKTAIPFLERIQEETPTPLLDLGGGWPTKSVSSSVAPRPLPEFTATIAGELSASRLDLERLHVVVEPGRSLVEAAGSLLCSVVGYKYRDRRKIVLVDAGTNLAASIKDWHHPLSFVRRAADDTRRCAVYGPMCFEQDRFAAAVPSPSDLKIGDLFVVGGVGAYDMTVANDWMRPRPPIIGLRKGGILLLRRRGADVAGRDADSREPLGVQCIDAQGDARSDAVECTGARTPNDGLDGRTIAREERRLGYLGSEM